MFKKFTGIILALVMVIAIVPNVYAANVYQTRHVANYGVNIEPADYHTYETEHFQIIWGDSGESDKVTDAFLKNCEVVFENCWNKFVVEMGMTPPTTSRNNKSVEYKINAVLMNTGLPGYGEGWAYGGIDSEGYPYFMCDVDAMTDGVVPHEMGHVMHFAQGDNAWEYNDYLGPWYEAIGNWFREQYWYDKEIYFDESGFRTDLSPLYLRATALTATNGRAYYEAWPLLQYLTDNPENLPGYGETFVAKLLNYRPGNYTTTFYEVLDACRDSGVSLEDTIGSFASHMATMDFDQKENYNKKIERMYLEGSLFPGQRYTIAESYGDEEGIYTIPMERAPQAMGYNIIPLKGDGIVTVTLYPLTDISGAAWRARLIAEGRDGITRYSALFGAGETQSIEAYETDAVYLSVAATPDLNSMQKYGIGGWTEQFSEANMPFESKNVYPYAFSTNAEIDKSILVNKTILNVTSGAPHPNGGGFVASSAHVDDSVYVAPNAYVLMAARVTGNARIEDNAVISGAARISGSARIGGNAVVYGAATVTDNAYVGGNAVVMGEATVSGAARVIESACIAGYYNVTDNAVFKGQALAYGGYYNGATKVHGNAQGYAIGYGDFFEDENKTIAGGAFSGYHSLTSQPQLGYAAESNGIYTRKYVPSLSVNYEFNSDLSEEFGSNAYSVDEVGISGEYLSFDNSGYIVLSPSGFLYDEMTISMRLRAKTGTILSIGDDIVLSAEDGYPCLKKGDSVIRLEKPFTGDWQEVSISVREGSVSLTVDGRTKSAETERASFEAGKAYLGKGFKGDIDYLRVYSKEVSLMEDGVTRVFDGTSWNGWTKTGNVTLTDGITVSSRSAAEIRSPGYGGEKFVIEFEPSGDNIYPDHAFFDKDGKYIFAHRYAADASVIYTGRGEMNFSTSAISDTAGQKRLDNFAAESVLGFSSRTDRGAAVYKEGDIIRITAENKVYDESLAAEFSGSVNVNAANLASIKDGDKVYTVTYAIVTNGLVKNVSSTLYKGSFNGFSGIKTYNPSANDKVVKYGDLKIYADMTGSYLAEEDGKVTVHSEEGGLIIFAVYEEDALVKVFTKSVSGGDAVDVPSGFEKSKVMFIKSSTTLEPLAENLILG